MSNPYESPETPPEPVAASAGPKATGPVIAAIAWTLCLSFALAVFLLDDRPTLGELVFGGHLWFQVLTTPITVIVAVALLAAVRGKRRILAIAEVVVLAVLQGIAWYKL
jgi:hypothetical protein